MSKDNAELGANIRSILSLLPTDMQLVVRRTKCGRYQIFADDARWASASKYMSLDDAVSVFEGVARHEGVKHERE